MLDEVYRNALKKIISTDELAQVFTADNRNAVDPVFGSIKIALIEAVNKEDNIQLAGSRDSVVTI